MIYFSKSKGNYYCNTAENCVNCNEFLDSFMVHITFNDRREKWSSNYCKDCFTKIKEHPLVMQQRFVLIDEPPADSILVNDNPPELGKGEISVFEMADRKIDREKIIDNTIHANRVSWNGASVGSLEYTKEKEPAQLTEKKFNALIEDMRGDQK